MKNSLLGSVAKVIESPFNLDELIADRFDGVFIIDRPTEDKQYKNQKIKRKANREERMALRGECSHQEQFLNEPTNSWVCKNCGEVQFSY